jgi:hypothetical protein
MGFEGIRRLIGLPTEGAPAPQEKPKPPRTHNEIAADYVRELEAQGIKGERVEGVSGRADVDAFDRIRAKRDEGEMAA